jgi:predicted secreted acid phosphatase
MPLLVGKFMTMFGPGVLISALASLAVLMAVIYWFAHVNLTEEAHAVLVRNTKKPMEPRFSTSSAGQSSADDEALSVSAYNDARTRLYSITEKNENGQ